jgi:hypothetical protein
MRSVRDEERHPSATTTMPHDPGRSKHDPGRPKDDLKERVATDMVLSAAFAAIAALCVLMFVGLYCWSRHAPIFPPDNAAGPAIEEPWSG